MKTVGAWEGCPTRPGSGMLKTLTGEQGVGGGGGGGIAAWAEGLWCLRYLGPELPRVTAFEDRAW